VAIDSREVSPGCLFVALDGERADGHDFIGAAIDAGARVVLAREARIDVAAIEQALARSHGAVIGVDDPLSALQQIAGWHRGRLSCRVVGVTGSTGKTTTKDLLYSVLSARMRTVATQGNRNNELGVPLTLLSANAETEALIVEMGMRGLGQIARLCEFARPDLGLVTNVGTSHIELLGSQAAVASAKGELVRAVPASGRVFVNGDDEISAALATESEAPVTLYGLSDGCAVRATDISTDEMSHASFQLVSDDQTVSVRLPIPGRHNVYNALAAAAVGLHLGIGAEQVARGLSEAHVSGMRMESFTTASGITVLNDAYNANPSSMAAAVDTLAAVRVSGKRVAVLGDMAELGSLTELAHFEIGERVARAELDVLVTVGERASRIADGARAEGMAADFVRQCATVEEAAEVLDDVAECGDAVLVKASRVMCLEQLVEGLVNSRVR
jgi:UDP-N-acetylmuramoyl-tripeptide--D-alanyl-D-alanine ligase